jgi:hypothetical protein
MWSYYNTKKRESQAENVLFWQTEKESKERGRIKKEAIRGETQKG